MASCHMKGYWQDSNLSKKEEADFLYLHYPFSFAIAATTAVRNQAP